MGQIFQLLDIAGSEPMLRGCWLYSKKCCFQEKTTLFIHFGPRLIESLWEGVQRHHEAVGMDSGAHGDDMHVHQTPGLKAG
jgi:hypothetical protein